MSARVVNPFSLYEMRRLSETVAASRPVMSFTEARERVCRNLYGRASADDSRAFAAREMAEQRERAAERWGFDFAREAPRTHGPGAERFKWTRVKIGTVPAAYRVPRMLPLASTANANAEPSHPHETARTTVTTVEEALIVAEAATAAATTTVVSTTGLVIPDLASPPSSSTSTSSPATTTTSTPTPPTRQSTIPEYMNIRKNIGKRALSSKKAHHLQTEQPPAKRARASEPNC